MAQFLAAPGACLTRCQPASPRNPSSFPKRTCRVVRVDISQPGAGSAESWQDVIPQHPVDLLQWGVLLKGGLLAVCYLHDVQAGRPWPPCLALSGHAQC